MNTIVLNAMFAGAYGEKNIDGEIINFYLDDNGIQNYFIPEYGYLPEEVVADDIKAILMISKVDGFTFEIIGKYVPEQATYIAQDVKSNSNAEKRLLDQYDIKYGGVLLTDLCPILLPSSKQFSRVSYRGGKVYFLKAGKRIILSGKSNEIQDHFDCDIVQLDEYSNIKWGSKNYRIFSKEDGVCYKNRNRTPDTANTYDVLLEIVEDASLWSVNNAKVALDIGAMDKIQNVDYLGLNHIIDGSHIELLSSNWLAHYINMAPENFLDFFALTDPEGFISVKREKSNIDILVEFSNHVVVIENKIHADIVKNSSGYSCQLEKYYEIVENDVSYANKEKKYIILCPDYEKMKITKQIESLIQASNAQTARALRAYEIKTYSQLKQNCLKYSKLSHAKYYTDLLDFIDDHSNVCEHYKKRKLSEKRFLHNIAINL